MTLYTGESPKVQHAYINIAEFFDTYALAAARRYLKKIVKTAGSFRYWRANPSSVLFFFEKLLQELQFHTLNTSSVNENEDIDLDALRLYLLLSKLIEAAHLIEVRAINEIGGEPRHKWKGQPVTTENTNHEKEAI